MKSNDDDQNASAARPPATHERNSDDNSKPGERVDRQAEVSDLSTGTFTAVCVLPVSHSFTRSCIVHE